MKWVGTIAYRMNQLKAGAALNYVSILLNMVVGLIYTPYMLRMLGQSEYGLYSLAASVIAYLTVLDLGFGNAVVRYTSKFIAEGKKKEQEEMFGMFFLLYIVIGAIALTIGALLSLNVEGIFSRAMTPSEVSRTRIMLWVMTFNLAFTFPMSIWGSIMTAYERFVFQRIVSIIRSAMNPLVMVLLLAVGYKAVAMVIVTTIFNVITLLINCWYCKHKLLIKFRFAKINWGFLKEVSVYSFWIFLNVIMDRIYWSTGQFVLGIYKGTVAVSVYAVAIQIQNMYMLFSTSISGVMLPKVTNMVTNGDDEKPVSDLFIRMGRIQYIIIAFILSAFVVFGKTFISLWAGENYSDAYYICLVFFFPFTIDLIQNIGITILQARNQMKFRSILLTLTSVCSLVLSIILVKPLGYFGCAIATGLGLFCGQGLILNSYYYHKQHIDIPQFWRQIAKMSIVPIIMAIIGCLLLNSIDDMNFIKFMFLAIAFTLFYVPALWKFGMNAYERELFAAPCRKVISRFYCNGKS